MRILYHHRTLGDGAEGIHIQALVDALRIEGHRVKTVSLVGDRVRFRRAQDAVELRWDRPRRLIPGPLYELAELLYNAAGYRLLRREIAAFDPDVVYDRYAHHSFAALLAARRTRRPLILEVNSPYAIQKRQYEELYFPRLSRAVEARIFRAAPHLIAVSSPLATILHEYGVAPDRITVLPNGTDPERFRPRDGSPDLRARYGLGTGLVLGFVGILRRWHRLEILFDALAAFDLQRAGARMVVIGDGPSFDEARRCAQRLGLAGRVLFLGRIPHADMSRHVDLFDVAISPDATPYSSPMKILEYMAMGKTILAPRQPNIEDVLEHGRTAWLFEPGDAGSIRAALDTLAGDPSLRERLGRAARAAVLSDWTWQRNAREVVAIARRLRTGTRPPASATATKAPELPHGSGGSQ